MSTDYKMRPNDPNAQRLSSIRERDSPIDIEVLPSSILLCHHDTQRCLRQPLYRQQVRSQFGDDAGGVDDPSAGLHVRQRGLDEQEGSADF